MSFNIGLSGLRAASKDLNVTGNNIANAGTVGFKQSRAEFSDVYAASMGVGKNPVGSGVLLANVAQQFNQGNINYTQNALDLAINGSGFFQVSNNGALSYTRAGYFGTDKLGNIVDNFGYNLQGYTVDDNGNLQVGAVGNLQIKSTSQDPKATSQVAQTLNLNSTNTVPVASPFDPADPTTYNSSTSTRIYDTQGNSHVLEPDMSRPGDLFFDLTEACKKNPGGEVLVPLLFFPACGGTILWIFKYFCSTRTVTPESHEVDITKRMTEQELLDILNKFRQGSTPPVTPGPTKPCGTWDTVKKACSNPQGCPQDKYCADDSCACLEKAKVGCGQLTDPSKQMCDPIAVCVGGPDNGKKCANRGCACAPVVTGFAVRGTRTSSSPESETILSGDGSSPSFLPGEWEEYITIDTTKGPKAVVSYRNTRGDERTAVYTDDGRLITAEDLITGTETTFMYDGQGKLQTIFDNQGGKKQYSYDANGRLTQIVATSSSGVPPRVESIAYDLQLSKSLLSNYILGTVSVSYDLPGATEVPPIPLAHFWLPTRDNHHQRFAFLPFTKTTITTLRDSTGRALSTIVVHSFDDVERTVTRTYRSSYDASSGNLVKTEAQIDLDGDGQPETKTVFDYAYDQYGRRSRITTDQGGIYTYNYGGLPGVDPTQTITWLESITDQFGQKIGFR